MEALDIISRHKKLNSGKENFNVIYQEIGDFCHPNSADFNRLYSAGEKRNRELFDQTAQMAIDLSSSSLIGLTANPASRWFHVEMSDEDLNRNAEVMEWCEHRTDSVKPLQQTRSKFLCFTQICTSIYACIWYACYNVPRNTKGQL